MKFLHDVIYKGSLTADGSITVKGSSQFGDSRLDVHNVYGALTVGNGSTGTDITALTVLPMGTGGSVQFRVVDIQTAGTLFGVQENGYVLIGADYITTTNGKGTITFRPPDVTSAAVQIQAYSNNTYGTHAGLVVTDVGMGFGSNGGNSDIRYVQVSPTYNVTNGGQFTIRGFYYSPTITNLEVTTLNHYAWENTVGEIKMGNLAGTGTRMVVADATGKLGVQEISPAVTLTNNGDNRVIVGTATASTVTGASKLNWFNDYGILALKATASWGYGAEIDFDNTDVNGTTWGFYGGSTNDTGFMLYRYTPSQYELAYWNIDRYSVRSDVKIGWSSTLLSFNAMDTALAREAAGLVQINNGSLNTYASLKLLNLTATGLAGSGTRMVTVDANGLLGSQAIPTGGTGSSTLAGLTDVTITSVANNQLLKYDSGTSKWINWTPNYLTSYTEVYQGTVTSVSVVSANGFAGTVATDTTTPAITLSTTVTGLLKGNGTAISAASAGTDYEVPLSFSNGLTRTTNAIKLGGTISENTTLDGTDNSWNLVATNMKKVTLRAGTAGSMVTGRFETSVFNDSALSEMDVSNAASTKVANVTVYENGGTPYVSIFAKGSTISNPLAFLQLASGSLEYSSGIGSATLRFSVDAGGIVSIHTTPSLNNTATNILVRDSGGQIQYRTVASLGIGNGTVTSVSVVSANGFAGTVATDTTTPAITLSTTVTGLLKGDGTGVTAAVAGTDYLVSNQTITLSGAVTGSGTTSISTTLANSIVGIANLSATGTPSASTYLRGDNTWATISTGGGYTVTSQTANYTATATSGTLIIKGDTTGGLFTVTLPTAVGNQAIIIVKKTAGTANLKIDGNGTETIDGSLTVELVKENESLTLISDNANWQIV